MSTRARTYDSSRRAEQAAETRKRIAASARALFVARGFGSTTIGAIAADAGVATPTVYAAYGSKRAILMELLADMEAAAGKDDLIAALAQTSDPREQLRAFVDFDVQLFTRAFDVVQAVRSAGKSDPEFAELRVVGESRRRAAQAPLIRGWMAAGAIRSGVSEAEAADVLFTMTGDELYHAFVHDAGWNVQRYRAWLFETLARILLR